MNKKLFKLSTLAFTVAAMLNTPAFAEGLTLTAGEFVQNSDGTVTHTPTGLIWQACSVGQTWNSATGTCSDEPTKFRYNDSFAEITSDFAGKTDWRVPSIVELATLVDLKKYQPALNKSLFPQTPLDYFASSTPYPNSSNYLWNITFYSGKTGYGNNSYVRLVRGEPLATTLKLTDFVDNKDGSVTHTKTGLTWQRCAVGQTWNDGYCDGKPTGYTQEKAAKLTSDLGGKTDWRLPTFRELVTILDYAASKPATNVIAFPDAPSVGFWTATLAAASDNYTTYAWYVDFETGGSDYASKTESYYSYAVRLVRGAMNSNSTMPSTTQTDSVDLSATLSANPSPAQKGGDLTYTATITNKGKATATNATVTFYIAPNFMSFKNASAGCETTPLSVVCNIGDLAAGGSTTKTMTVNLKKSGGISASVLVKSNENDANPADNVGKVATGVKK